VSVTWEIREGDALDRLAEMEDGSVNCCITSPPYFGLRDYGNDDQIGLEKSPEEYVSKLVEVFGEVKRTLAADGTLWLVLGDSYAGSWGAQSRLNPGPQESSSLGGGSTLSARQIKAHPKRTKTGSLKNTPGCKGKDLIGIPWMVAFALRADGWFLRSEVIWAKANPMPESVIDRPTKAHEQVFLLSKSARYYYEHVAIREADSGQGAGRNKRSVWSVATRPYPDAHFATFPPKLVEPMVLAGCPGGGLVLDPFAGSGTTLQVAVERGRNALGIELNPAYVSLAESRLSGITAPLFATDCSTASLSTEQHA
jgi:DNA modification methylase